MQHLYIIIAIAGFGLFSHWANRWQQGRTGSGFIDYMKGNWGFSLGSVSSVLMACGGIYKLIPAGADQDTLIFAYFSALGAGYMCDSIINRDPTPSVPVGDNVIATKEDVQKLLDGER